MAWMIEDDTGGVRNSAPTTSLEVGGRWWQKQCADVRGYGTHDDDYDLPCVEDASRANSAVFRRLISALRSLTTVVVRRPCRVSCVSHVQLEYTLGVDEASIRKEVTSCTRTAR
jgi:hypothetical protein